MDGLVFITDAKIFGVLGAFAYAAGCYLIFGITALGNSTYWRTEFGGLWHVITAFAAIVFCIVANMKPRTKPGEAARWLLASAGVSVAGQLAHAVVVAVERPSGLAGRLRVLGIFLIVTIPAFIGSLFAKLGSRNRSK